MSDYIKREDALNAIHGLTMYRGTIPFDSVIFNINKIPTADVVEADKAQKEIDYWHDKAQSYEQTILKLSLNKADVRENVRGEWIDAQYPFSKCSICDCYFDTANNEANFCPNCGADMRGGNNG